MEQQPYFGRVFAELLNSLASLIRSCALLGAFSLHNADSLLRSSFPSHARKSNALGFHIGNDSSFLKVSTHASELLPSPKQYCNHLSLSMESHQFKSTLIVECSNLHGLSSWSLWHPRRDCRSALRILTSWGFASARGRFA